MGILGVTVNTTSTHGAGAGPIASGTVQELEVKPVPLAAARALLKRRHYLHSMPGATQIALGVFARSRLMGAMTLGCGPANAHRLVEGAIPADCLTITRLWLSDDLPKNSESRTLGMALRVLRRQTTVKFVLAYADPSAGHLGVVYQAANFLYTGLSVSTPVYQVEDRPAVHSRTLSQVLGTRNLSYLKAQGLDVRPVRPEPKYRYAYFLDSTWGNHLLVPVLPYPKREATHARD